MCRVRIGELLRSGFAKIRHFIQTNGSESIPNTCPRADSTFSNDSLSLNRLVRSFKKRPLYTLNTVVCSEAKTRRRRGAIAPRLNVQLPTRIKR